MNFNVKIHVTKIPNNRVGEKMAVLQKKKNNNKQKGNIKRDRLSTIEYVDRFKVIVLT